MPVGEEFWNPYRFVPMPEGPIARQPPGGHGSLRGCRRAGVRGLRPAVGPGSASPPIIPPGHRGHVPEHLQCLVHRRHPVRDPTEAIGKGWAGSLTMGAGQFCTNPGLLITIDSPALDKFLEGTKVALAAKGAATMLTPGIHSAYNKGVAQLAGIEGVSLVGQGKTSEVPCGAVAALYETSGEHFLAKPELEGEIFGPTSLLIRAKDGQLSLTATDLDIEVVESIDSLFSR